MSSADRDDDFFIDEFLSNPIQVRNWVLESFTNKWLSQEEARLTDYESVSWYFGYQFTM